MDKGPMNGFLSYSSRLGGLGCRSLQGRGEGGVVKGCAVYILRG